MKQVCLYCSKHPCSCVSLEEMTQRRRLSLEFEVLAIFTCRACRYTETRMYSVTNLDDIQNVRAVAIHESTPQWMPYQQDWFCSTKCFLGAIDSL